jgi:hypothetical protein
MKLLAGLAAVALSTAAFAAPVYFSGGDAGALPGGLRPLSDAAAASFDAAAGGLGAINLINFESQPLGPITSNAIGFGTTLSVTNASNSTFTTLGDVLLGYNTTSGGQVSARIIPNFNAPPQTTTFNFTTPVQAFGTYITGFESLNGNATITFNDGSSQNFVLAGQSGGGAQFFGFTDAGASIASIVFTQPASGSTADFYALDDVRLVFAAVPTPAAAWAGAGLIGLLGVARRIRKA